MSKDPVAFSSAEYLKFKLLSYMIEYIQINYDQNFRFLNIQIRMKIQNLKPQFHFNQIINLLERSTELFTKKTHLFFFLKDWVSNSFKEEGKEPHKIFTSKWDEAQNAL